MRKLHMLARIALLAVAVLTTGCDDSPPTPWEPVVSPVAPSENETPRLGRLISDGRASPGCSAFVAGAFIDLPFGALFFVAVALAAFHRRRARVEQAFAPGAPLRDGPAVIFGAVEAEGFEQGPPVQIRIRQRGSDYATKGGTRQAWKEIEREVVARSFLVRRDDGALIRVEPGQRVVLHGELSQKERIDARVRMHITAIRAGDRVHVSGELSGAERGSTGGAYRGSTERPTLRSPRLAPMVISTEPPGDTEASQARFHARGSLWLAACFLTCSALVAWDFQILTLDGSPVLARPSETRTFQRWVKPKNRAGYWVTHFVVRAQGISPSGAAITLEDELSEPAYDCVGRGRCRSLPFLVSRHLPSVHQLGDAPTMNEKTCVLFVSLGFWLGLIYPGIAFARRPWYAKRKVNEDEEGSLTSDTSSVLPP